MSARGRFLLLFLLRIFIRAVPYANPIFEVSEFPARVIQSAPPSQHGELVYLYAALNAGLAELYPPAGRFSSLSILDSYANSHLASALALSYPLTYVLTLHADTPSLEGHKLAIQAVGAHNAKICRMSYEDRVRLLKPTVNRFDVTLLFDAFPSLLSNGTTQPAFESSVCGHLSLSRHTFLRLPSTHHPAMPTLRRWYGDNFSLATVLRSASRRCKLRLKLNALQPNLTAIDQRLSSQADLARPVVIARNLDINAPSIDEKFMENTLQGCDVPLNGSTTSEDRPPACTYFDRISFSDELVGKGLSYGGAVIFGTYFGSKVVLKLSIVETDYNVIRTLVKLRHDEDALKYLNLPLHVCVMPFAQAINLWVLPVVKGRELAQILTTPTPPLFEAPLTPTLDFEVQVGLHLAKALAVLHRHRVVYPDLHLYQILVNPRAAISILIDFERVITIGSQGGGGNGEGEGTASLTTNCQPYCGVAYRYASDVIAPPEAAFGCVPEDLHPTNNCGTHSDVHALGQVLWRMLPPNRGKRVLRHMQDDHPALRLYILNATSLLSCEADLPAPVSNVQESILRPYCDIIRRCVDRDAKKRPTALQVAAELSALVAAGRG